MFKKNGILKSGLLFLFGTLLLVSCREIREPSKKEHFDITMEVKVLENDRFKLYYTVQKEEEYNEGHMVEVNVQGQDDYQEVQFSLPEIPNKFRIDLGESKIESMVCISEITISYKNDKILIYEDVLHRFFKTNIYLEKRAQGYYRKSVGKRYDPFLESTALLLKKIDIEF